MNVVQQLPQLQNLNVMSLSIFPDSLNINKVSGEELTLEPLSTSTSNVVVDELISFTKSLKEYGEMNCYQDVCNLSDSLSGEATKTKYLLTLT